MSISFVVFLCMHSNADLESLLRGQDGIAFVRFKVKDRCRITNDSVFMPDNPVLTKFIWVRLHLYNWMENFRFSLICAEKRSQCLGITLFYVDFVFL